MGIVLTRIDDRLIHGQVVEGWLKNIVVGHIAIISKEVAADKMQQVLFSIAVPKSIKVSALGVEEAVTKYKESFFDNDNFMLLLSTPQDVLKLIEGGVRLDSVNVGGMHFTPGKKQILKALSVDESDIKALMAIHKMGVKLEGRVLPGDDMLDIVEILTKKESLKSGDNK
jgi:PTS system mannose-specific IIB component